jgi:septal ring factor EnvC (AmiA/AmiB activator)
MLEFLAQVQRVELVDDGGWFTQHLDSFLLAIAAICAAGLAAYVAIRNHREQLAYDRHLRNQDHIRDTVDAAAAMANETVTAASLFQTQVKRTETLRTQLAALDPDKGVPEELLKATSREVSDAEQELTARDKTLYEALVKMHPMSARLQMRLGESDQITNTYETTRKVAVEAYGHIESSLTGNRQPAERASDATRVDALRDAFNEFRTACHDWFRKQGT